MNTIRFAGEPPQALLNRTNATSSEARDAAKKWVAEKTGGKPNPPLGERRKSTSDFYSTSNASQDRFISQVQTERQALRDKVKQQSGN